MILGEKVVKENMKNFNDKLVNVLAFFKDMLWYHFIEFILQFLIIFKHIFCLLFKFQEKVLFKDFIKRSFFKAYFHSKLFKIVFTVYKELFIESTLQLDNFDNHVHELFVLFIVEVEFFTKDDRVVLVSVTIDEVVEHHINIGFLNIFIMSKKVIDMNILLDILVDFICNLFF